MEVSTGALGRIVGPLNKRMRQEKMRGSLPPSLRIRRRVKRMSLDLGYLPFIGAVREPVPLKPVRRYPAIKAARQKRG